MLLYRVNRNAGTHSVWIRINILFIGYRGNSRNGSCRSQYVERI